MSLELINQVVRSLLYEGYMLYPYRKSSLKNQHRWNFGVVSPAEPPAEKHEGMTTECLVTGDSAPRVTVEVRFLQLGEDDEVDERSVKAAAPGIYSFTFGLIEGVIEFTLEEIASGLQRVRVQIANTGTPAATRDETLRHSMISTHTILAVENGEFISLLDPPEEFRQLAAACQNTKTWPVLIGKDFERSYVLSSPIILYDYPRVAPESPGDLFDGLEIDEILILRILTLSDAEKDELRRGGERERQLLERVEAMDPEELLKLHGTIRDIRSSPTDLKPGDRVRLRPKSGGDIFDVVLDGKIAIVESIEHDFDNRTQVAVVIEDDPGKDLGMLRYPGHRFFFSGGEMERLP